MNISLYIAKRYLFSKKSVNAINVISAISMLGVFVGSAALVIILSVFNGFETIVLSMYNTFSPDLRIELVQGKVFDPADPNLIQIKRDKRVANYSEVLQEKALVRYGQGQAIAQVKGVSYEYGKGRNELDSVLSSGAYTLQINGEPRAVIGAGLQTYLSVNVADEFRSLEVYSPRKGLVSSINPADEFNVMRIAPAGVLMVQQEYDDMMIVPLSFARQLLGEESMISSIEIELAEGVDEEAFQRDLSGQLGDAFQVKNRAQQNQLLYKILNSEKWAIFLILTFVLIIAIFNIIGSLTMLVIDKRKDIAVLTSLGADNSLIRRIFFTEGMLISMLGCFLGMFTGLIFCLLQQQFGFIKMSGGSMLVDSYPVALKGVDFLLVFATVVSISLIASSVSSRLSVTKTQSLRADL